MVVSAASDFAFAKERLAKLRELARPAAAVEAHDERVRALARAKRTASVMAALDVLHCQSAVDASEPLTPDAYCRWAMRWARNWTPAEAGATIIGPVGSGKSTLTARMAGGLMRMGWSVCYTTAAELSATVANARYDLGGLLRGLAAVDVLFIEDIGAGEMADWRAQGLLQALDRRWAAGRRPIVCTTNESGVRTKDSEVERRIRSRVLAMAPTRVLYLYPGDRRLGVLDETKRPGVVAQLREAGQWSE